MVFVRVQKFKPGPVPGHTRDPILTVLPVPLTFLSHILTNSQLILMVQGQKLMEICVGVWSNPGIYGILNWFFISLTLSVKLGNWQLDQKKLVYR